MSGQRKSGMRLVPSMAGLTSGFGMPASCRRCRTAFSFSERVGAAVARTARSCLAPRWSWVMRSRRVIRRRLSAWLTARRSVLKSATAERWMIVWAGVVTGMPWWVVAANVVGAVRVDAVVALDRGRDHVGVAAGGLEQLPQHGGRPVRERRAGAAGLDGREAPRLELDVRVGQGVNTPIKGEQDAALHSPRDRVFREAALVEIGRVQHAQLASRDLRHASVHELAFFAGC